MHITTSKTLSAFCWPLIKTTQWLGRNMPVTLIKLRYFVRFHRLPNLKNPKDLNEKILWQKLYADISEWVIKADKYRVREFVESIGLGKHLVKLYGKWNKAEDIDFDSLPNELIFKANNGDGKGTNLIVHNLQDADKDALKIKFSKWLNDKSVGDLGAEPQYRLMTPCVIAEELLPFPKGSNSLVDYKIWCINGKAEYIFTCSERDFKGGHAEIMVYDRNWKEHPEFAKFDTGYSRAQLLPEPKNLKEMMEVAEKLSAGNPILRVDLYDIDGKIYFGELTFTSLGGMMDYFTPEFLHKLGAKADISHLKKVRNL